MLKAIWVDLDFIVCFSLNDKNDKGTAHACIVTKCKQDEDYIQYSTLTVYVG